MKAFIATGMYVWAIGWLCPGDNAHVGPESTN